MKTIISVVAGIAVLAVVIVGVWLFAEFVGMIDLPSMYPSNTTPAVHYDEPLPTRTPIYDTEGYKSVAPKGIWCQTTKDVMVCVGGFAYATETPLQYPGKGNKFVVFVIKVFNQGKSNISVSPLSVTLVDLDGVTNNYDMATYEYINPLPSVSVMAEDMANGVMVFQLRKDQGPGKVVYRDLGSSRTVVVDLRRAPDYLQ